MTDSTIPTPQGADRPDRSGGAPAASVDYEFAKRTGRAIVNPGPQVSSDEAAPLVVDRPGWISANVDSFRSMLDPVVDKLNAARKSPTNATAALVGGKVTGAEMGALLAFLSSKVLGQYDLAPNGTPRLLLVAPNIVATERRLEVDPTDFRRWVAMHEETHRVQFTAVPWLREHMVSRTQALAVDLAPTPEDLSRRFEQLTKNLPQVLSSGEGVGQLFATPEQKAQIAELTAVMSLLEGHADVVMDDVGPRVIPTVGEIRRKFDQRRNSAVGVDRLLRKLLGLEAKMRQYRDGAVFVRAVTDRVGRDGFNAVWSSPETLPRAAEILDPDAWVRRVHG